MAHYINTAHIKKKCHGKGRNVSASFLRELTCKIDDILEVACKQHNGGRKTLTGELFLILNPKKK